MLQKAFYSYYWEMGDGNYSTKAEPKHTYKKPGDYEIEIVSQPISTILEKHQLHDRKSKNKRQC